MEPDLSITVISCLYGNTHDRFLGEWIDGIQSLDPKPQEVILSTDRSRFIPQVNEITHRMDGGWKHTRRRTTSRRRSATSRPTGSGSTTLTTSRSRTRSTGVDEVGSRRVPDGVHPLRRRDVCAANDRSQCSRQAQPVRRSGSCVRTAALRQVGGFPDCALQDWALWKRLALAGKTFLSSDRVHFWYRRHNDARGQRELTLLEREAHTVEMEACLASV